MLQITHLNGETSRIVCLDLAGQVLEKSEQFSNFH
jgi:hypothetical protein